MLTERNTYEQTNTGKNITSSKTAVTVYGWKEGSQAFVKCLLDDVGKLCL